MADEKNIRHRFAVPVGDKAVNEWIELQSHLGFSLRVLIKAFIRDYGMQDATCLELGVSTKKRGRPPKSASIKLQNMLPMPDEHDVDRDETDDDTPMDSSTDNAEFDDDIMSMIGAGGSKVLPRATDASDFVDPDDLM